MKNTDTSELLRLCDEMLNGVPTGDETLGHIKDCCTLARALKSRLQAEAQAPAVTQKREREGHKYADHDGTSDCAYGCGAWAGPYRSGAPNGINPFGECPKAPLLQTPAQAEAQAPTRHRAIHSLAEKYGIERMALSNLLHEWEAQAPTTAAQASVAPVPSVEVVASINSMLFDVGIDSLNPKFVPLRQAILALIPRLTVGAPAPAHTMPTREQIARTLCIEWYSESVGAPAYDTFGTSGKEVWLKQADAILAMFAKGDTP